MVKNAALAAVPGLSPLTSPSPNPSNAHPNPTTVPLHSRLCVFQSSAAHASEQYHAAPHRAHGASRVDERAAVDFLEEAFFLPTFFVGRRYARSDNNIEVEFKGVSWGWVERNVRREIQ